MQVILQQDVPNLGKKGELKDVSAGYARNHLIPRNLVVEATPQRLREWKDRQAKAEAMHRQHEDQAKAQAEKLSKLDLLFKMPAGDGGRLFGSVTQADIASKLADNGYAIDKKKIDLSEQIKSTGSYTALIKLYPGVKAELNLRVKKEE